jgi:hypothetical protein
MASQIYVATSILALLIIVVMLLLTTRSRREGRLRPLTVLAFACVVAGLIFGENRLLGYSLFGVGVLLAVIDMIARLRRT